MQARQVSSPIAYNNSGAIKAFVRELIPRGDFALTLPNPGKYTLRDFASDLYAEELR